MKRRPPDRKGNYASIVKINMPMLTARVLSRVIYWQLTPKNYPFG